MHPWRAQSVKSSIGGRIAIWPLIEELPALTHGIADRRYLPAPVVFTTGIADAGDAWIVASGEADLACRISHIPKTQFD